MNDVPMVDQKRAGHKKHAGKYVKDMEDYVPKAQYLSHEHQERVVADILQN